MAKMDGYTLLDKMRKMRRKHPLTATEQALYHELVAICNEESWADIFSCSNYDLCSPLQVSENTLEKARNTLIQVGLLFYKSGKSRRTYGQYSFSKNLTTSRTTSTSTSKFEVDKGGDKGVDSWVDVGVDSWVDSSDIYKDKTKTKTETKTKLNNSFSVPPTADTGGKKKEDSFPHWGKLVEAWFIFYEKKFNQQPSFTGGHATALKSICQRLKKFSEEKQYTWEEAYAVRCLNHFLNKAYEDDWLKANFLLTNLSTKFDSIVNTSIDGTTKSKQQPTGGNVSASSILSKIASMPD